MKVTINKNPYYCDTYALIQLSLGGENYDQYIKEFFITSDYNLMELYYSLLRNFGEKVANHYYEFWCKFSVQISQVTIKKAMKLKLKFKKQNLSYVDCIGWAFSLEKGIQFLTGDQKFENKHGAEFAK